MFTLFIRRLCHALFKPFKLDIHVVEHCNLNCSGCTHYSPLAKREFADLHVVENSLKKLSKYRRSISAIQLLGGEPLLNPELPRFFEIVRKYFPKTRINLLTNGILLLKQEAIPEAFWVSCRNNNVTIRLTRYPIKLDYDKIVHICLDQKVQTEIFRDRCSNTQRWSLFRLTENFKHHDDRRNRIKIMRCQSLNCYQLVEDKIFACSHSAYIRHLNQYFGTKFSITRKDYLQVDKIKGSFHLKKLQLFATPFCRYCQTGYIESDWSISKKERQEWVTE